jgi:hypothetical protein
MGAYSGASNVTALIQRFPEKASHDQQMDKLNTRLNRIRVQVLGVIGIGAFAVLAIFSVAYGSSHFGAGTALAGSGDAPANTTYAVPSVAQASMGATATWTAPATTMAVESAAPAVKAGG